MAIKKVAKKIISNPEDRRVYEQSIKPYIKSKSYGLVDDLININPMLQQYMTKQELREMEDYHRKVIHFLDGGLEALTKKLKAMKEE